MVKKIIQVPVVLNVQIDLSDPAQAANAILNAHRELLVCIVGDMAVRVAPATFSNPFAPNKKLKAMLRAVTDELGAARSAARPTKSTEGQEGSGEHLLRLRQVEARVGLKKTAIYQRISAGTFPAPVKLSPKAARWSSSEIEAWLRRAVSNDD